MSARPPEPVSFAAPAIARSLVAQVGPVLPESARVTLAAEGSTLRITDGRTATEVQVQLSAFGAGEMLSALEAETATRAVLSTIQDIVMEALTMPWPSLEDFPQAVVRNASLSAWYGTPDAATLQLGVLAGPSG